MYFHHHVQFSLFSITAVFPVLFCSNVQFNITTKQAMSENNLYLIEHFCGHNHAVYIQLSTLIVL